MKLTIEEVDGGKTIVPNARHLSVTDMRRMAVTWWERMDGQRFKYEQTERKPRRIVLEFGDEAFPASVNYGQVRR